MATTFEQLQELLILSGEPIGTGTPEQWSTAHRRLGRRFPVDYLQFVSTYGYCLVDDQVVVLNPFEENGQFWDDLEREHAMDGEDIEVSPPDDPRTLYPRPKGMIPWGSTSDGGSYLWVTDNADPDSWTVFVEWDLSGAHYRSGLEDFFVSALRGQLDAFALGDGFPSTLPAYADPVVPKARGEVSFDPPLRWGYQEVATLCRLFEAPVCDSNMVVARPSHWRLRWSDGSMMIETRPEDIDAPKAQVAALAAALGVRITSAAPDSWADLVD